MRAGLLSLGRGSLGTFPGSFQIETGFLAVSPEDKKPILRILMMLSISFITTSFPIPFRSEDAWDSERFPTRILLLRGRGGGTEGTGESGRGEERGREGGFYGRCFRLKFEC